MKQTTKHILILFIIFFINNINLKAQNTDLYNLGKNIVDILKSDYPEKIVDEIVNDNFENKANILESFLKIKEILNTTGELKDINYFNTVKGKDGFTYIILKKKPKFYLIKVKIDENNTIKSRFDLVKTGIVNELSLGEKVYYMKCFACHGIDGKGGLGPNLTDDFWKYVDSEPDLLKVVEDGKKGTTMMAFKDYLSPEELQAVIKYIKALIGKKVTGAKKPEGEKKKVIFYLD